MATMRAIPWLVLSALLLGWIGLSLAGPRRPPVTVSLSASNYPPDELKDFKVGRFQGKVGHKWRFPSCYSPTLNFRAEAFDNFSGYTDPAGDVRFVVNLDYDDDSEGVYNANFWVHAIVTRGLGVFTAHDDDEWETYADDHHYDRMYLQPEDSGFDHLEEREYTVALYGMAGVYRKLKGEWKCIKSDSTGTVTVIENAIEPYQQVVIIDNPVPDQEYVLGTTGQVLGRVETEEGDPVDDTEVRVGVYTTQIDFRIGVVTTLANGSFSFEYRFPSNPELEGSLTAAAEDDPKNVGIYNDDDGGDDVVFRAVYGGDATVAAFVEPPGFVPPGESGEFWIGIVPFADYTGTVDLSIEGLEGIPGLSWSFDRTTVTLPPPYLCDGDEAILTVSTSGLTPEGSYPFTLVATGVAPVLRSVDCTLEVGYSGACYAGATCFQVDEATCLGFGLDYLGDGTTCPPPVVGIDDPTPSALFRLHPSFPNPFNPSTTLRFDLAVASRVSLAIYDVAGRKVRTLLQEEFRTAGAHQAGWDGRDDAGEPVASGVYFYRLRVGEEEGSCRMALIR